MDTPIKGKFFNKELLEVDLIEDKKTGMLLRPGSSDKDMLMDCVKRDYKQVECKDQVVLDLGANIGGFMYRAARDGAKQVISYEPEPTNFDMLHLNMRRVSKMFPGVMLEAVNEAVYNVPGTMDLAIRAGGNANCSCSITRTTRKNGQSVSVKVEAFKKVLDTYKPTFIKIDVEGAEYAIFEDGVPEYVKHIAFELHGNQEKMAALFKDLQDKAVEQGNPWTVVAYDEQKIFGSVSLATGYIKRS